MSREDVLGALAGEEFRLVCGVTWLPAEALGVLASEIVAPGPAESLVGLVQALALDFAVVGAHEPWAGEAVGLLQDAGAACLWSVAGVFGRAGQSVGWTEMLRMSVTEPGVLAIQFAEALHEALVDIRTGVARGADAILVADDLAGATGPLVSPDFALDALLPCYESLADEARGHGLPAVFHSDGDIRTLLGAVARAGYCGVHLAGLAEQQLSASFAAARSAGLVALGGIAAAELATTGARRIGNHAGSLARIGGLLLCDDGGIAGPQDVTAFASALEVARDVYVAGVQDDQLG